MEFTFVNVGYGEAMVLSCPDSARPDGRFCMVIDGGSGEESEYLPEYPGRIRLLDALQRLGCRHIDVMVSTHIHEDHVCGLLPAASFFRVGELWQALPVGLAEALPPLPEIEADDPSRRKFYAALRDWPRLTQMVTEGGGRVEQLKGGDVRRPAEGLSIRVLLPGEEAERQLAGKMTELYAAREPDAFLERLTALDVHMNNYSLILSVRYEDTVMLLPGDTNASGYGDIDRKLLKADLFKVGHHGQRDGADQELLRMIQPQVTVCCASSGRRYGSADPGLLRMIKESGSKVYFSDSPPVPDGMEVPPVHSFLRIRIGKDKRIEALYI